MVLFNYSTRELTAKIVYYGPGLCGKTTNLQYVYENLPENVKKGKMLSLATKTDRTLFFDFLPIELGTIRGMKTRVQLYTVPGQVFYNSTRKLVLKGADGVVFVADSQAKMLEANSESYKNLEDNLREMGLNIEEIPLVMQFNKRDLPNLASVEEMNTQINRHNAPFYEAVATTGIGVEDTLKAITKLVLNNLATKYKLEAPPAGAEAPGPAAAASRPAPPGPRPVPAPARAGAGRASIPVAAASPEDLALDALEIAGTQAMQAPARPAARPAAAPPAPIRRVPEPAAELVDLGDELDLGSIDEVQDDSVDLGGDLLAELEEPAVVAAPSHRAAPARAAAPRPVPRPEPVVEEEPIDLDEPMLLEEEPLPAAAAPSPAGVLDIGRLAPGQDRTLDIPLTATVDGRPVRLTLRVTVRLSR